MLKYFHSERGAAHLLLVFILVAVIGAVGFFAYKAWNENATKRSNDSVSATPTPTPDPYAGWKIYKFSKEGFSVRYPSTWTLKEKQPTETSFGGFSLRSQGSFVLEFEASAISPDGGYGPSQKTSFIDEIKDAKYGKSLYIVAHYDSEWDRFGRIVVNDNKSFHGHFRSKITDLVSGYTSEQYKEYSVSNYVSIWGEYKDAQGGQARKSHAEALASEDLKEARKILNSLRYD